MTEAVPEKGMSYIYQSLRHHYEENRIGSMMELNMLVQMLPPDQRDNAISAFWSVFEALYIANSLHLSPPYQDSNLNPNF